MIIQLNVAGVVGSFGYAPWHTAFLAILNLSIYDRPVGLVKKGVVVIAHHQERHQILKHRAGPRLQNCGALVLNMRAVEMEPAFLRDLTFSDADKYRSARFGSQQVVMMFAGRAFRRVEADCNQPAGFIVHQREIHSRRELVRVRGNAVQGRRCLHRAFVACVECFTQELT